MTGETSSAARDRFDRNLACLATIAPALHQELIEFDAPAAAPVLDPSLAADLRARAAAFLRAPFQLTMGQPRLTNFPDSVTDAMRDGLDEFVADRATSADAGLGRHRAEVLVVFGVGLGVPIDALMETLTVRHLIIAEPEIEMLWHSLWVADWAGWAAATAVRGGEISIYCERTPSLLADRVFWRLRAVAFGLLDGLYVFAPRLDPISDEALEQFLHRRGSLIGAKGFFEDEMLMLGNGTRNLQRCRGRYVNERAYREKETPAVIVGAGPSLDRALPAVGSMAEHAVVFSAGTTLGTLLARGITPDFQCEIENRWENYEVLARVAAQHARTGVRLLSAVTVDPRIPPLFDDLYFYLRDANMAGCLYGAAMGEVPGTGPNCVNMAVRLAVLMGFRTIYLFGVDLGSRKPAEHHVADSIWVQDEDWAAKLKRIGDPFAQERPGNFGGKIWTNHVLDAARVRLEALIDQAPGVRFFNCSDGARISGAVALLPARAKLDPSSNKLHDLATMAEEASPFTAEQFVDPARLSALDTHFTEWARQLSTTLNDPCDDLIALLDRLAAALAAGAQREPGIPILAGGSLMILFHHAFHLARRHRLIDDPAFVKLVSQRYQFGLDRMRTALRDQIVDLLS